MASRCSRTRSRSPKVAAELVSRVVLVWLIQSYRWHDSWQSPIQSIQFHRAYVYNLYYNLIYQAYEVCHILYVMYMKMVCMTHIPYDIRDIQYVKYFYADEQRCFIWSMQFRNTFYRFGIEIHSWTTLVNGLSLLQPLVVVPRFGRRFTLQVRRTATIDDIKDLIFNHTAELIRSGAWFLSDLWTNSNPSLWTPPSLKRKG